MTFTPTPTSDTNFFWEGCKEKKLIFQICSQCGHVRWPPSIACPKCHSTEYEYVISQGKGKIYSFSIYRVPFHSSYKDAVPYVIAVVELEEGPMILTNIVNCNPSELQCDFPVKIKWTKRGEFFLPTFEPA